MFSILFCAADVGADEPPWHASAGDVLQTAIPLTAVASTFVVGDVGGNRWDRQGTRQFLSSYTSAWLSTQILKQSIAKTRPDGKSEDSHPSGHTASAWSGAAFLGSRYGGLVGWLGYAGATLTGVSRVLVEKHYADDVLAGASLAQLWNWVFVTPHFSRAGEADTRRWRFQFFTGVTYFETNHVTAGGGTSFDLTSFHLRDDPQPTAAAGIAYRLTARDDLDVLLYPFETRDHGYLREPVSLGGRVFPADTELESTWRMTELRIRWIRNVASTPSWRVQLGAGLVGQHTLMGFETRDASIDAQVERFALMPQAVAALTMKLPARLSLNTRGAGAALDGNWMLDIGGSVAIQLDQTWQLTAGYRHYSRDLVTRDFANRVAYRTPFLSVEHEW
jgi:hypothetical protein